MGWQLFKAGLAILDLNVALQPTLKDSFAITAEADPQTGAVLISGDRLLQPAEVELTVYVAEADAASALAALRSLYGAVKIADELRYSISGDYARRTGCGSRQDCSRVCRGGADLVTGRGELA